MIEFTIIYICLGLIFLALAAVAVLLVLLLKKNGMNGVQKQQFSWQSGGDQRSMQHQMNTPMQGSYTQGASGGVVFCKRCATQFDASQRFCPNCGAPR